MFTYLASPYSHKDPKVRQERFKKVCDAAFALMKRGEAIFCPIAHSHPIDLHAYGDHNFWMKQDIPILRHAAKMTVLMLDGWENSKGIKQEIETAQKLFIPIEYVTENDIYAAYSVSAIHPPKPVRKAERQGTETRVMVGYSYKIL